MAVDTGDVLVQVVLVAIKAWVESPFSQVVIFGPFEDGDLSGIPHLTDHSSLNHVLNPSAIPYGFRVSLCNILVGPDTGLNSASQLRATRPIIVGWRLNEVAVELRCHGLSCPFNHIAKGLAQARK